MLTREDQVVLVQKPDGSKAVQHADGTRITSWYQDRWGDVPAASFQKSDKDASQPGDDGTAGSDREKVVSVEKEGCATVVVFPERRVARVVLADGSVITGSSQGSYEASRSQLSHFWSRRQRTLHVPVSVSPRRCVRPTPGSSRSTAAGRACTWDLAQRVALQPTR